jgi:hypothetical protein
LSLLVLITNSFQSHTTCTLLPALRTSIYYVQVHNNSYHSAGISPPFIFFLYYTQHTPLPTMAL